MEILINFVTMFIIVYLFYSILTILRKRNPDKYRNSNEIRFLEYKHKVDVEKVGINKLSKILGFWNAIIISSTVVVISFIDNLVIKMLVGFIMLLPLILLVYYLLGKHYAKNN